jgi:predicted SAM-dependent methyltransferase
MTRKEKILRHIDKNGLGVEIGPSHNPVAPKKDGYNVHIIDHMTREELIDKFKPHNVNLDKIEHVDFVWNGETYADLIGKTKHYDWIIASHIIEHTPDLIGFLNNCDAILKEEGKLSLIIPDKRYCFDHYRPITGISQIIDSYFRKSVNHTPGTLLEFVLNSVSKSDKIAWTAITHGNYRFRYSLDDAFKKMNSALSDSIYHDAHAWCFTPNSFRLIINDLYNLKLISFKEVDFFPTDGCEFYITLGRSGEGMKKPRLEVLKIIESEIKNTQTVLEYFRVLFSAVRKKLNR